MQNRRLFSLALLLLFASPSYAVEEDSVRMSLDKAKKTYEETVARAEAHLIEGYDKAIEAYGNEGELAKAASVTKEKESFLKRKAALSKDTFAEEKPTKRKLLPTTKTYVIHRYGNTGHTNQGNVYKFNVEKIGRKTRLIFYGARGGNKEGTGEVYLTDPDGKRSPVFTWSGGNTQGQDYSKSKGVTLGLLKKTLKPITVDVSKYMTQPGEYSIRFQYKQGYSGLHIYRVAIVTR